MKEKPDLLLSDPMIGPDGRAKVDIVVFSIHINCPKGNAAGNETVMSQLYYNGQPIHLEAATFNAGVLIPRNQDCSTCGTPNGLEFLGSDLI